MEICHWCSDTLIEKPQTELLAAATQAMVHTFGWPIGGVWDTEDHRPRPTADGILASRLTDHPIEPGLLYDYWFLSTFGDFYTLMGLVEDCLEPSDRVGTSIFPETRIARATEALLHCANLYRVLGVDPNAHVKLWVDYHGLRGRTLKPAGNSQRAFRGHNLLENEVMIAPVTFRVGSVEDQLVELVKKICAPLFVVFDFARVNDQVYEQLVGEFAKGKVT
jgi:hypothetical protein